MNKELEGKCGYIALYKGKKIEVYTNTSYDAQLKAAQIFKAKHSYDVSVYLCEKDGKEVLHSTTEF